MSQACANDCGLELTRLISDVRRSRDCAAQALRDRAPGRRAREQGRTRGAPPACAAPDLRGGAGGAPRSVSSQLKPLRLDASIVGRELPVVTLVRSWSSAECTPGQAAEGDAHG